MTGFIALVLVTFTCFALVFYIKQRQFRHPALNMPYQLRRPVLQAEERELLALLTQAVASDYLIMCKIRVADVVDVTAPPQRTPWYQASNRISAGCFDFLLCDPQTLNPICAIEMEPASEDNAFLDELCKCIALPLVRLPVEKARSYREVLVAIERATTT